MRVRAAVLAAAIIGLAAAGASGSPGVGPGYRPDPSFGGGKGWVATTIPGTESVAYAMTVVAGGKIVLAGQASPPQGNGQIIVARYTHAGSLDPTFATGGIFKTALPSAQGPFIATSIAQDSENRLLVGGGYGQGSMLVLRLTPNGRLDRSFGQQGSGMATTSVGGIAQSLALLPNGGILLGGSNANVNGRPMVVARFTRNGSLDRTFGRRGLAQILFWNANLASSAGVIQMATTATGGVIGFGHLDYIGSDGHGSAGVFRLSANGTAAPAFGTAGHVEVAFTKPNGNFGQWFPCAMGIGSSGRITVAGDGSVGPAAAILSTRLTGGGTLDNSYGTSGRTVIPGLRQDSDTTCGAASTRSGGLTVGVGTTIARLGVSGALSRSLTKVTQPPNVSINAVVRTPSGRLLLAGSAGNALYLARFTLPAAM